MSLIRLGSLRPINMGSTFIGVVRRLEKRFQGARVSVQWFIGQWLEILR